MAKVGFERKRPVYASSAEECRQRGFKAGDRLVGDEGHGPTVIQLTAIGEENVLAKTITVNGKLPRLGSYESAWTLECRDWEKVETLPAPPPETREC